MTKFIKIYGDKRTGTNYAKYVIEVNFEDTIALMNTLGWKHGPHPEKIDWTGNNWVDPKIRKRPKEFQKLRRSILAGMPDGLRREVGEGRIRYLVCVRDPVCSYMSQVEVLKLGHKVLDRYIKHWNRVYKNWSNLVDRSSHGIVVKHEDLMSRFQETMARIGQRLDLEPKDDQFKNVEKKLRRNSDENWNDKKGPLSDHRFNPQTNDGYKTRIPRSALIALRKGLDPGLLKRFGYTI